MNSLTQIGKQIGELFASLTPSARIMAGLMAGVIVVSLGWVVATQQSNHKTYVLGVLSPDEIRTAEQALGAASLGNYEIVGSRIQVPAADKAEYLNALSQGGAIPMHWTERLNKSLEAGIFDPPSLVDKRAKAAKEQVFAETLKKLSQVDYAVVSFDERDEGFGRVSKKVCSIEVGQLSRRAIDHSVLRYIAEAATTHFAGLKKEDVSVFDVGSASFYRARENALGGEENPVLAAQAMWEKHYTDKLHGLLNSYGAVKLAVSVELDPKLSELSEKLQYDPTGVTTDLSSTRVDAESNKDLPGGRPGASTNGLNKPQAITQNSPTQSSTSKETAESTKSLYGKEAIQTQTFGLIPTEVKISVAIPESHYRNLYDHRKRLEDPNYDPSAANPDAAELDAIEAEVLTQVEEQITVLPIGFRDGEKRTPFIKVSSYTDLPLPELPQPSLGENTVAWLGESWSTLAMLSLVLISLGMMFSWVRSQPGGARTRTANLPRASASRFLNSWRTSLIYLPESLAANAPSPPSK